MKCLFLSGSSFVWRPFSYAVHELVNFSSHLQRRTTSGTGSSHAGQEQSSPAVVEGSGGSSGRDVHSAAPELGRSAVPAGASERADGGAAQAGCSDAGGVAEVQVAGGDGAAASCRRAEDPPPQQEGRERNGDTGSRREGCDADGDLLHGSCEKPKHLFKFFILDCLLS